MGQTDISVAVCTYNRAEMLRRALRSLLCQETDGVFSYEIVVVDDASTDNTADVVREIAARSEVPIRYVRKEGGGVAAARNAGVTEARGRWIAFFDDDEWTEANWLKNLLAVALEKGADCVGGTCLLDLPQEHLSRLSPLCRGILGENIYGETPARLRGKRLPPTGNLLIARGVFDSIGVFDTSMLYGGEDSDFVVRARAAGLDIWIAPDAVVHHVTPPHRLERAHLRWCFLRWGSQSAQIDCRRLGWGRMLLLCLARIGQAMLVNVPWQLVAVLRRDKADIADRKAWLWRAVGYIRESLFLVAPNVFPQKHFFARLGFRGRQAPLQQR
jgi:glycosyltransferase involved in cell wall biosynthesis